MQRNEQKVSDTWDLTSLSKDDASFYRDLKKASKKIKELKALKGTLGGNADSFYHALSLFSDVFMDLERLGSYAFLALERFLRIRCGKLLGIKGFAPSRPYYMQFTMRVSEEEFYKIVAEEAKKDFDPMELLYPDEVPVFEKYDEYVPEELVRKGFAYGVLDIEGMKRRVIGWSAHGNGRE